MIKRKVAVVFLAVFFFCFFGVSSACETSLSCEEIQEIAVVKGTDHLAGGVEKTVYVACVYLDVTQRELKEVVADCPKEMVVMWTGKSFIEVPVADISTDGSWFSVIRSTPDDALAAAQSICSDKVKSYLQ